ncbi:hypothetical protein EP7_005106 [Isosphaeraceae bacterium EP7]
MARSQTRHPLVATLALAIAGMQGCATLAPKAGGKPAETVRLQDSGAPTLTLPALPEPDRRASLDDPVPLSRNDPEDKDEDEPVFPDIHSDPLAGSSIPESERDPFLLPWAVNLIHHDRWRMEEGPSESRLDRFRRQARADVRDPGPDTANFPNGAYTLPKGRAYLETSPVGFYAGSRGAPRQYNWEFLLRYGLTDSLEFRIFSSGFTATGGNHPTSGFSPLAFDIKAHFWDENRRYFIPAVGAEIYLQTQFGSPAYNGGVQPSINLLLDNTLPLELNLETNFGMTGAQDSKGAIAYQFSYQWALEREVADGLVVFVHGFYNAAALPRITNFQGLAPGNSFPNINVVGAGTTWAVNDRIAIFGSYNFGTTPESPQTIALLGFAIAL